jgi:hypothetical protein
VNQVLITLTRSQPLPWVGNNNHAGGIDCGAVHVHYLSCNDLRLSITGFLPGWNWREASGPSLSLDAFRELGDNLILDFISPKVAS